MKAAYIEKHGNLDQIQIGELEKFYWRFDIFYFINW